MSYGFEDSKYVLKNIVPRNLNGYRVLDVGCGFGFWGWVLRMHTGGEFYLAGIEINPNYIEKLSPLNIYDNILHMDITKDLEKIPNDSFDLVIASHVIEHLEKNEGWKMLDELRRICRKILIVLCPEGDAIDYDEKTPMHEISKYDYHRSAWHASDFKGHKGFKIRQLPYSHRAGRATALFEKVWNRIKRRKRGGSLIIQYKQIQKIEHAESDLLDSRVHIAHERQIHL